MRPAVTEDREVPAQQNGYWSELKFYQGIADADLSRGVLDPDE
jgi:hypothetical protein